mgnify:CR=1 FL=1
MNREQRLRELLSALEPTDLVVGNESHMHAGPPGRESHFRVIVVSPAFAGMSRVQRHREVNRLAAGLFDEGLHALAIEAHTPEEWQARGETARRSPPCEGANR